MNLIKIKEQNGIKTVNARELWRKLESKQKFADWIKKKVLDNPFFEEEHDYILLHNSTKQVHGGHNRKDFALTIDTSKKVAMAEQTAKGEEVRKYFINCEKKLKQIFKLPETLSEALLLAGRIQAEKEQLELENQQKEQMIEEQKPKVDYANEILQSTGTVTITQIAKDYGMSAMKLNAMLHKAGIQYKQRKQWLLYSHYANRSYTESATMQYKDEKGNKKIKMSTYWTQKGRLFIHKVLEKLDIKPTRAG